MTTPPTVLQIFLAALRLGCTSFGGPIAHLAYFRRDYVERRRWLSESDYADLVALCQFLPGPASSQVGFGVGYLHRGWAGGLAAWTGFTLPSAVLMIGFALGLAQLGAGAHGWLHGLKIAATAVVAQAVIAMWRSLAPDWPRSALAVGAAALLLAWSTAWSQVAVIALGTLIGALWFGKTSSTAPTARVAHRPARGGLVWLALFFALLVLLPLAARMSGYDWLVLADKFYRTGALVFGGGHVMLPLLEHEVVTAGFVSHEEFLAGYGAAQALPGPLFTFAAYLGAVNDGVRGGLWTLAWIFAPSLLLVPAALPAWNELRRRPRAQAALRGANAAVVGLLLAALITPIASTTLVDAPSVAIAGAAFVALQFFRAPSWLVVVACAAAGAAFA